MNRKVFSFFLILIALIVGAFYYTDIAQKPLLSALNSVKINYKNVIEFIENGFSKHFFQASQIATLKTELQRYENNHLVMQELATEVNDLYQVNKSSLRLDPRVELVRTISYQKFANLNRVWIEMKDFNKSKIYGLTYKELVAGIVIAKNSKPLGLLNRDIQSSFAVFVGSQHAPGIAHGNNEENIVIKYIPSWFDIKRGDEVTTSGLDNIFFKGLKVGQVLSVTKSQGYQNAIIDQYYKSNDPNYFYLIRKLK
jgi:rod shape-determining protein MreC